MNNETANPNPNPNPNPSSTLNDKIENIARDLVNKVIKVAEAAVNEEINKTKDVEGVTVNAENTEAVKELNDMPDISNQEENDVMNSSFSSTDSAYSTKYKVTIINKNPSPTPPPPTPPSNVMTLNVSEVKIILPPAIKTCAKADASTNTTDNINTDNIDISKTRPNLLFGRIKKMNTGEVITISKEKFDKISSLYTECKRKLDALLKKYPLYIKVSYYDPGYDPDSDPFFHEYSYVMGECEPCRHKPKARPPRITHIATEVSEKYDKEKITYIMGTVEYTKRLLEECNAGRISLVDSEFLENNYGVNKLKNTLEYMDSVIIKVEDKKKGG